MTPFQAALRLKGYTLCAQNTVSADDRTSGQDWPADAETMIGLKRLENIQECVTDAIEQGVAGDLIETGVWRGGACIFMRAILKAYGESGRTVWVADSFEGVPKPDPDKYPADAAEQRKAAFYKFDQLAVSVRFARRAGVLSEGLVSRHLAHDPSGAELCRHSPGRRPVRIHMGCADRPVSEVITRWLLSDRRLRGYPGLSQQPLRITGLAKVFTSLSDRLTGLAYSGRRPGESRL